MKVGVNGPDGISSKAADDMVRAAGHELLSISPKCYCAAGARTDTGSPADYGMATPARVSCATGGELRARHHPISQTRACQPSNQEARAEPSSSTTWVVWHPFVSSLQS